MSKKLDDLDMGVIQELAKQSPKVQDLIREKDKALSEIEKSQNITFKKPDPAPKPKGDIRITKRHQKQTMTDKTRDAVIEEVKGNYNAQIKEAMSEKAIEIDKETIYPLVEQTDKNDLSILIEQGKQAFKERIEQKEKALEASLELDMDSLDDKGGYYSLHHDFETNKEDIDKSPDLSDDFEDY